MTPQRRAILDELRTARDHPSAAELYRRVQSRLPGTGFATVYKTLNLMAEKGDILELRFGDAASRFDGNTHPHSHGLCVRCGAIVDVQVNVPHEAIMASGQHEGFHPTGYRLDFYGLCARCEEEP